MGNGEKGKAEQLEWGRTRLGREFVVVGLLGLETAGLLLRFWGEKAHIPRTWSVISRDWRDLPGSFQQ